MPTHLQEAKSKLNPNPIKGQILCRNGNIYLGHKHHDGDYTNISGGVIEHSVKKFYPLKK